MFFCSHDFALTLLYLFVAKFQENVKLFVQEILSNYEINFFRQAQFFFHNLNDLLFDTFLLDYVLHVLDLIFKFLQFFTLLDVSLLKHFSSVLHLWQQDEHIHNCKERLSHGSHEQHKEDGNDMESDVHKLTTLFH